jgi:hypothetical protein
VPVYRLHDTTGDDLGLIEHPAPNVEPGDVVVVADGRDAIVTARVEAEPGWGQLVALLEVAIAPPRLEADDALLDQRLMLERRSRNRVHVCRGRPDDRQRWSRSRAQRRLLRIEAALSRFPADLVHTNDHPIRELILCMLRVGAREMTHTPSRY